ncbi:MAG: hypothetical protein H0T76_25810 [Nannocystis sp.]|nr:hypothetical protein [Nannocystis sp.]MBA3549908.1 hypothetical protein [Nannocystis sp.]
MRRTSAPALLVSALLVACSDDGARASATDPQATTPGSAGSSGTDASGEPVTGSSTTASSVTDGPPTSSESASDTDPASGTASTATTLTGSSTAGEEACVACDQPNQQCVLGECVTSCQGQGPDACDPGQVCDVISGMCKDPADGCVLAGPDVACGASQCGPGSVCDGQGACLPIAPCAGVACTDDGGCWGSLCACERPKSCEEPALELLNGPFSTEITALDFSDDCTAWMVTLRSGTDYLRRLEPDGTLTEWPGVSNLDMGEVKVLRSLTIPQLTIPFPIAGQQPSPPVPVEGLGEVALTYTCCEACGCAADPPQGVARLVEDDLVTPLPLVIIAKVTQGTGPFGAAVADAGPQGLTWGVDRVLYVGNSSENGDFNSADLDAASSAVEFSFGARVTASAPVSPVHLVVGLIGGEVQRFNVVTKEVELVVDLDADITGFSHDSFSGRVYAGLSTLEIVSFDPFTGEVASFDTMPSRGRVAVSPGGGLYFAPIKYLDPGLLIRYPLPDTF